MSVFGLFIMTTAIGIGSSRSPAAEEKDAYKALAKATYIQTGFNKQVKRIEKEYVPKSVREYGGIISGAAKIITEKKISFEWTF